MNAAIVSPSHVVLERDGFSRTLELTVDTQDPNRPRAVLNVVDGEGRVLATPYTLWLNDSGGRLASDKRGCDPSVCVVDNSGFITTG